MSISESWKQKGTVQEFYEAFVPLFRNMDLNESYIIDMFTCGLQPEIGKCVTMIKPKTLKDAYCVAKMQETTNNLIKERNEGRSLFVRKEEAFSLAREQEPNVVHQMFDEMPADGAEDETYSANKGHKSSLMPLTDNDSDIVLFDKDNDFNITRLFEPTSDDMIETPFSGNDTYGESDNVVDNQKSHLKPPTGKDNVQDEVNIFPKELETDLETSNANSGLEVLVSGNDVNDEPVMDDRSDGQVRKYERECLISKATSLMDEQYVGCAGSVGKSSYDTNDVCAPDGHSASTMGIEAPLTPTDTTLTVDTSILDINKDESREDKLILEAQTTFRNDAEIWSLCYQEESWQWMTEFTLIRYQLKGLIMTREFDDKLEKDTEVGKVGVRRQHDVNREEISKKDTKTGEKSHRVIEEPKREMFEKNGRRRYHSDDEEDSDRKPGDKCDTDALFSAVLFGGRKPYSPTKFLYSWWQHAGNLASYEHQDAREIFSGILRLDVMCTACGFTSTTNYSSEVQQVLQASGFTPQPYASGSVYMMLGNHKMDVQIDTFEWKPGWSTRTCRKLY